MIRYHMYWPYPGNDPFWYADSFELRPRRNYYPPGYLQGGVWYYATPWLSIDGRDSVNETWSLAEWQAMVDARAAVQTPLTMTLSGSYNPTMRQGRINVHIVNTSPSALSLTYIRYALTESGLRYNAPNGERIFGQVLRKFFSNGPDTLRMQNGDTVTIAGNATLDRGVDFHIRSNYNADSCELVVFVQKDSLLRDSTKEIIQGSKILVRSLPLGVETAPIVEQPTPGVWLGNAEPTPFKSFTRISYGLPSEGPVSLVVYNLVGAKVRTLVSDQSGQPGRHQIVWDGRNDRGATVPKGIYFFELRTPSKNLTIRAVLVR
jgi:hypothetical protein